MISTKKISYGLFLFCLLSKNHGMEKSNNSANDEIADDLNLREYYERGINNEDYLTDKRKFLKSKKKRRFSDSFIKYFKTQDLGNSKATPRCKSDDILSIKLFHKDEQKDTPQTLLIKDKIIPALNSAGIYSLSATYPSDAKVSVKNLNLSGYEAKEIYEISITSPDNKIKKFIGKVFRDSDACYEEYQNLKMMDKFLFEYRLFNNSKHHTEIPKFPVFIDPITIIDGENGLSPILVMNKAKGVMLHDAFCKFCEYNIRGETLHKFMKELNDVGNQIGNFHCRYGIYEDGAFYSFLHSDLHFGNIFYYPPSQEVQFIDNGTMGKQLEEKIRCDYDLATLFYLTPARHRRDIYAYTLIYIEDYKKRQISPKRPCEMEDLEKLKRTLEERRQQQFSRIDLFLQEIKKGYLESFKFSQQEVQAYLSNIIDLCIKDGTWKQVIDEKIEKDILDF